MKAKWLVMAALAGLIAAFGVTAPPRVVGQTVSPPTVTPTPSPTPSPTATPTVTPSAADLLAQMVQAIVAKNTFHEVSTEKLGAPGVPTTTIKVTSDVSLKPVRVHEVDVESGTVKAAGKTRKLHFRITTDTVGKRAAVRIGKGKWTCGASEQSLAGGAASLLVLTLLKNPVYVGTATIRGIPAWQVRATLKLPTGSAPGGPLILPIHFYISQLDFTLMRETITLSQSVGRITLRQTSRADITNYGEMVKVKLPAACKKK